MKGEKKKERKNISRVLSYLVPRFYFADYLVDIMKHQLGMLHALVQLILAFVVPTNGNPVLLYVMGYMWWYRGTIHFPARDFRNWKIVQPLF